MSSTLQFRHLSLFLSILFGLSLLPVYPAYAVKAPQEVRKQAIPLSSEATDFMASVRIPKLADDRYFGEMLLRMLNRQELTGTQKVEIFYAMLKSIGWGFSGAVRIPAYYDYFQVFGGYVASFLGYQERLTPLAYDVSGLLEIVRRDVGQHTSHASHALLLAMFLDAEKTRETLEWGLTPKTLRQVQVPEIWMHYLALGVVLSRDASLALTLGGLLYYVETEEEQEDILCALGAFDSDAHFERIRQFIYDTLESDYTQAVETAVLVVKHRVTPNEFYIFYMELLSEAPRTFHLKELQEREFRSDIWRDNPKKVYLKVWDNFDLRVYDDGILLTYKDTFSDFM